MARNALQNCAYLYVVHEREFIHQRKDVYKVGYTTNIIQRMSQYPKGSVAVSIRAVPRSKAGLAETMLLAACRKNQHLMPRRDIGAEYFEGSLTVISELVAMAGMPYYEEEEATDVDMVDVEPHEDDRFRAFMLACCDGCADAKEPTSRLLAAYHAWAAAMGVPGKMDYKRLGAQMTRMGYQVKVVRHQGKRTNCYMGVRLNVAT